MPRDVGFGLVVIVVGDEVLHRVLGEEIPELGVVLRGEGFIVGDYQRGPLHPRHHIGDGEGFARAGRAEQNLVAFALLETGDQRINRLRLVAGRLI